MNLKAYLAEKNMTIKDFSILIGVRNTYLSAIIHGHYKPSARLSKSIEHHTGGKVRLPSSKPLKKIKKKPTEQE